MVAAVQQPPKSVLSQPGRTAPAQPDPILYDSKDLTAHAVIIGMTGSVKTGLGIGLLEEALIDRVPVVTSHDLGAASAALDVAGQSRYM